MTPEAVAAQRLLTQKSALTIQSGLRGARERRRTWLRPMTRVQILLKGRPGLHRGLVCWRGQLKGIHGSWLGVALDKPLGHHDGEREGTRYFKCESKHGVFVMPSRAREETKAKAKDPMDAGFDLSSDETDGEGSFGLSDSDEARSPLGAQATGSKVLAAADVKKVGWDVTNADPELRLALAIQNMVRGKNSRADTEDKHLKELFVMPPKTSTGETIEQLVGEDGVYSTMLTVGHDSDKRTGAWTITVDVREPIIIHHVTFDVGNDPRNPVFFKTDFTQPFSASVPSGVLQDGDKLLVQGRFATRLGGNGQPATARSGKPAEPLKRLDTAYYGTPQLVTLLKLKSTDGEIIDLKTQGVPPCDARLVNPRRVFGLGKPGGVLSARVVIHFHKYFDAPPLALEHTIRFDGQGGAAQHPITLTDPDKNPGGARRPKTARSMAGYLLAARAAIRLQRNWRDGKLRREAGVTMRPTATMPRGSQQATAIQAAGRGARARSAASEQRASARQRGLESWSTMQPRTDPTDAELLSSMVSGGDFEGAAEGIVDERTRLRMYDEFQETLPEAQSRRAQRQKQHDKDLHKRALQRERDGVNKVVCRQAAPSSSQASSAGTRRGMPARGAAAGGALATVADESFYADDEETEQQAYASCMAAAEEYYDGAGAAPPDRVAVGCGSSPSRLADSGTQCTPHGRSPRDRHGFTAEEIAAASDGSYASVIQAHQRRRRASSAARDKRSAREAREAEATKAELERAEEMALLDLMRQQQQHAHKQAEAQMGRAATRIQSRQRRNSASSKYREQAAAAVRSMRQSSLETNEAAVLEASLGLSNALARVLVRCKRRWRIRTVASRMHGAALMRAATLGSSRSRTDTARAEMYLSMRHADFVRLLDGQMAPHRAEKLSAVAAEDYDTAKRAKAVEGALNGLYNELEMIELQKAQAVMHENFEVAVQCKQRSDTLRVQIALHMLRANSTYFRALHPAGALQISTHGSPRHSRNPSPPRAAFASPPGSPTVDAASAHPMARSPNRSARDSPFARRPAVNSPVHARPGTSRGLAESGAQQIWQPEVQAPVLFSEAPRSPHMQRATGFVGVEPPGGSSLGSAHMAGMHRQMGGAPPGRRRPLRDYRSTEVSQAPRIVSAPVVGPPGGSAPPRPRQLSWQPAASREVLASQLSEAQRKESVLQAELVALKTRRRQRENRALAASKVAASTATTPSAARLRDELMQLQKQRDLIATKTRELQANKRRVRPNDIKVIERARALVNPEGMNLQAEAVAREEEAVDAAQAQVDRLALRQRDLLQVSQTRRATLARELVEERLLREELAAEVEE